MTEAGQPRGAAGATVQRTADRPALQDVAPDVARERLGISYSGGGPRVVLELGAIKAFIDHGVVPDVVAGVSAGAIAASIHALDTRSHRAVDSVLKLLPEHMSTRALGLTPELIVSNLMRHRGHLQSIGDHSATLRTICRQVCEEVTGQERPTLGDMAREGHPRLAIGATDWQKEESYWFGPDALLEDAVVASSAIPGIFPWFPFADGPLRRILIDGGVISNQPLSRLVLEGCGSILACGFRPPAKAEAEPAGAFRLIQDALHMLMHVCSRLEEDYVRLKLGGDGDIRRIELPVDIPLHSYDFSEDRLNEVVEAARAEASKQLVALGY